MSPGWYREKHASRMLLALDSVTSNSLRRHLYQRELPNQVWVCLMSFLFLWGFFGLIFQAPHIMRPFGCSYPDVYIQV